MHEQSESINRLAAWYNVYGPKTPQAGQVVPPKFPFERPAYASREEAEFAARFRSLLTDEQGQPKPLGWLDILKLFVPHVSSPSATAGFGELVPPQAAKTGK